MDRVWWGKHVVGSWKNRPMTFVVVVVFLVFPALHAAPVSAGGGCGCLGVVV